MPREITRIEVPEPEPMHPTDDGGAETQGAAYRLSAPAVATEPLVVTAPDGTALTWVPTELCYRDASGQMDYIVGSAPATVQVRDREARYKRTFPIADDVFKAEAERIKHWVILHEPPRAPADYLSGTIEFGVTGLVSGVELPEGRHEAIKAGPFRLPKPVARDLAGKEIAGYYEVVPAEGGQQVFVWFPADAILGAVYPLTIDPTVVTSSVEPEATFTDSAGIAIGADGAYYMAVFTGGTPQLRVFRSDDGGQTWADTGLPWNESYSLLRFAIAATDDGRIHLITGSRSPTGQPIYHYIYADGQWQPRTTIRTLSSREAVRGIAAYPSGIDLHIAYCLEDPGGGMKTLAYRRYDGASASWSTENQLGYETSYIFTEPSIVVHGGTVVIACTEIRVSNATTSVTARVSTGGSFSHYTLAPHQYEHPFAWKESGGVIHIVYTERNTGRLYMKSWTGSGWSGQVEVARFSQSYGRPKATTVESDICILWPDNGQIYYRARRNGVWTDAIQVTSSPDEKWSIVLPHLVQQRIFPVGWTEGSESPYSVMVEIVGFGNRPNAPILSPRENFDARGQAEFAWAFSDPDLGDSQSAYQLVIKRASDGAVVYDTGKLPSVDQRHVLPANTLENGVEYRWTVRTWDQDNLDGPYAAEATFATSAKPTATIIDPGSDGAVVSTSSYTIQWSTSDPESKGQSAYRVVLKDGAGNTVHDSGKVLSTTARAYTLQNLQNNTSYTVELTVWDGDGVASSVATRTFQVQYTPPPTPDGTVEALEAWVRITIANHNAGAEIQAVSNDVYRRKVGEAGTGVRIATGVQVDGVIEDYAVASGVAYEYRVVAVGANGTTAASPWVAAPVLRLQGAWLHDPADPGNTIRQFRVAANPERGEDWAPAMELLHPAGREHPIAEFGEQTDQRVKTAIIILPDSLADLHALRSLADLRTVLCYRDSAGRRIFGVLGPLNIRDERHGGYTVEIEIQAVDYDEAV